MWRIVTLFVFVLLFGVSAGLYHVKYSVDRMERQGLSLKAKIAEEKLAIRILEAEWSSLNRPGRLQKLSEHYLQLEPVQVSQVASFTTIPEKPGLPEGGNGAVLAGAPHGGSSTSQGQKFAATPAATLVETR